VFAGAALRPRWLSQPNLALHRTLWEIHITIFSSETTGPIPTKLPKMCLVIPTSNQDVAKLKIEKKGDEI
jgi:hypothetical protein